MKAIWNDTVIAESNDTILIEGNHYFPEESIKKPYFKSSGHSTVCPWKGTASYYDLEVEGKVNKAAVWYYPQPKYAAKQIKNYIAFWNGVRIEP